MFLNLITTLLYIIAHAIEMIIVLELHAPCRHNTSRVAGEISFREISRMSSIVSPSPQSNLFTSCLVHQISYAFTLYKGQTNIKALVFCVCTEYRP